MNDRTFRYRGNELNWPDLVRAMPDAEFTSPTRSTLPLLAWWRNDELPRDIIGGVALFSAEMEAAVTSTRRRNGTWNKSSYTDVMLRASRTAVAVEGKWTEPPCETVDAWRGANPTANKLGVLNHWLDLIEPFSEGIDHTSLGQCTYQMLHRAASACAQAREQATVVYQVFGKKNRTRYIEELRCLRALVRPGPRLRLFLVVVPLDTTAAWSLLQRNQPHRVRAVLRAGALFGFGPPEVDEV